MEILVRRPAVECLRTQAPRPAFPDGALVWLRQRWGYLRYLIAACAAARRAIGTRNGEQDT